MSKKNYEDKIGDWRVLFKWFDNVNEATYQGITRSEACKWTEEDHIGCKIIAVHTLRGLKQHGQKIIHYKNQ